MNNLLKIIGGIQAAVILIALLIILFITGYSADNEELFGLKIYRLYDSVFSETILLLLIVNQWFCLVSALKIKKKNIGFWMIHSSLIIITPAYLVYNYTFKEGVIALEKNAVADYYYTVKNTEKTEPLPFKIQMIDFGVEYYNNSKDIKKIWSKLKIVQKNTETVSRATVSINNPYTNGNFRIYQYDIDKAGNEYSILKISYRRGWLFVKAGLWLLLAGTILQCFKSFGLKMKT